MMAAVIEAAAAAERSDFFLFSFNLFIATTRGRVPPSKEGREEREEREESMTVRKDCHSSKNEIDSRRPICLSPPLHPVRQSASVRPPSNEANRVRPPFIEQSIGAAALLL